MRVSEQSTDAVIFESRVIEVLHAEVNVLHVTVGDEEIASLGFED